MPNNTQRQPVNNSNGLVATSSRNEHLCIVQSLIEPANTAYYYSFSKACEVMGLADLTIWRRFFKFLDEGDEFIKEGNKWLVSPSMLAKMLFHTIQCRKSNGTYSAGQYDIKITVTPKNQH